jgi:hypothetical protein
MAEDGRKLHNEELHGLHSLLNTIRVIKTIKVRFSSAVFESEKKHIWIL